VYHNSNKIFPHQESTKENICCKGREGDICGKEIDYSD